MSREQTPTEVAAIWGFEARHGLRQKPLPWSPYEARLTAADGTHEEPLPATTPEKE